MADLDIEGVAEWPVSRFHAITTLSNVRVRLTMVDTVQTMDEVAGGSLILSTMKGETLLGHDLMAATVVACKATGPGAPKHLNPDHDQE